VKTFARNDRQLHGSAAAIAILHTHSRRLDFHPHGHLVMSAAAIDEARRLWRTKRPKRKNRSGYLFNHQALAKVFRAKMLEAMARDGLAFPECYPKRWVVDCKHVGRGEKALVYLGRYLYRGVIQEKDFVACENGQVTFRYRDGKSQQIRFRTVPGPQFLWLVLQHLLARGLRRARTFGFLHPNSKRLIALLHLLVGFDPKRALARLKPRPALRCPCCGADMRIERTRIPQPRCPPPLPVPIRMAAAPVDRVTAISNPDLGIQYP
jgi:hypothetical protein